MPTNKPEVVLPELPEPCCEQYQSPTHLDWVNTKKAGDWRKVGASVRYLYTADQLRAYGQDCIDTLTRPADGDFVMVPRDVLDRFPEINPSNYDHEGVCALNAWGVELVLSAAPQQPVEDGLARIAGMTFLLHENPDADEDIPPTQLVMAMSVGDTVYCHRITHGNNGICRDDAPQQSGQELGEVERLREQMEIVWRYLQKVSPWHASNDMLWCDEMMVGIDLLAQQASQPQQPAEAVNAAYWMEEARRYAQNAEHWRAKAEAKPQQPAEAVAEYQYRNPGAHDDNWHRMTREEYEASLATGHCCGIASWTKNFELRKLYTTPPPAIDIGKLRAENERLNAIINTPQADDFLRAVSTESEHQRQRWGNSHDAGKEPADWFWLIGYLAGKALHAHAAGNIEKAEHHVITTAAACANWHRAMFGGTHMRPGIDGEAALIGDGGERANG